MTRRRAVLAAGGLMVAFAVHLALASPSPIEGDDYGFRGNLCDGAIVQAFAERGTYLMPATESRVCTDPARRQLAVATIVLAVGAALLAGGSRRLKAPRTGESASGRQVVADGSR